MVSLSSQASPLPDQRSYVEYLAVLGIWIVFQVAGAIHSGLMVLDGQFLGPDSYMRLVRVTELLETGRWYDSTLLRSNAPYGEDLHWTRPFDLMLLGVAAPLALLMDWRQSLHVAGVVISPLLQFATAFAFAWASAALFSRKQWVILAAALFLHPAAGSYALAGRADHHVALFLVFMLMLGFTLRALSARPDAGRQAALAGACAGLGLWLSVELILGLAACLTGLTVQWLLTPGTKANRCLGFSLGLWGAVGAAMLIEWPPSALLEPLYDEISVVHFALASLVLVAWLAIWALETKGWPGRSLAFRTLLLGVTGIVCLAAFYSVFPLFFAGPMATIDPRINPIWHDGVTEMRDALPISLKGLEEFLIYLGGGLIALPCCVFFLRRSWGRESAYQWLFLTIAVLAFLIIGTLHVRFSPYAALVYLFPFGQLLSATFAHADKLESDLRRGLIRGGMISLVLAGPLFLAVPLGKLGKDSKQGDMAASIAESCDFTALAAYLEQPVVHQGQSLTILALLDYGPELLYRTSHRIIAGPYHRNGAGIYDSHEMLATTDPRESQALMTERGVDLVLLCPQRGERAFFSNPNGKASLYYRLKDGETFDWLRPQDLPANLTKQFRLYRTAL